MTTRREREAEFRMVLRQSLNEPFGIALEGLLRTELDQAKTQLVDAQSDEEVHRLQGAARAYRTILKSLTDPIALSTKV